MRPFPATYAPAYQARGAEVVDSVASRQHAAYRLALERAGLHVEAVPADEAFYDCVFVEDTAIVWQMGVLMTTMGSRHREGEQVSVRRHLANTHDVFELPPGATLEGGDVMHTHDVTYVGLSSRTNAAGAAALAQFMKRAGRDVVEVDVTHVLHLKTAVTYLGNGTLIAAPGCVDRDRFRGLEVISTADGEPGAANCLRIGSSLLMPSGYPESERAVTAFASAHRLTVEVLNISEFEKGGGSLSCLSLMWRHEGARKS